ncbi:MAG: ATP-binding protein, partial [Thermomicrobiales bacterium]
PDLVLPAIARAAGVSGHGADGAVARIAAAIGPDPTLLVLDSIEHLLSAAPDLGRLLAAAPAVTALVTSREALRLASERAVPVHPLPVPHRADSGPALAANPAVALFLQVLAAAAPARPPQGNDAAYAAAIVALLDGLPLAIELAAVQGAILPLATIATLLDTTGLSVLARGPRDAPARFATMEAAIAWSTDLLDADAQRLFRLLGVFRGGFTSEAAIAVAIKAGQPRLVAALSRLAEAHLIEPDPAAPAVRLRMLEPVRMFALDRLRAAGEEAETQRAHAAHFLHWARALVREVAGPEPVPALDALDADLANLQAAFVHGDPAEALATAAALSQYWEIRTRVREGRAVLAAAIAAFSSTPGAPPPAALTDAIHWSGYLAYLQSDVPAVEDAIASLRPLITAESAPEYAARAPLLEVLRRDAAGLPPADSIPLARETYALVKDGPKDVSWHMSTVILANLLVQSGDVDAALPLLREYATWARARAAAAHFNSASDWLGYALLETGAAAEARSRFAESIAWSSDAGFTGTVYLPLMGYILASAGEGASADDLERAAILLGALDTDTTRHGYPLGERNAAALAATRGHLEAALGEQAFAALTAQGRDLPLEAALELVTN